MTSWEEEEVPRLAWEDEPAGAANDFLVVFSLHSDPILGSSSQEGGKS